MMQTKQASTVEITKLLRELLERHGQRIEQTEHPIAQLGTLMRAINIEWRRLHGPDEVPVPRILFLRAELITPEEFDICVNDDGRDRRVRIKRSSLYTHEAS